MKTSLLVTAAVIEEQRDVSEAVPQREQADGQGAERLVQAFPSSVRVPIEPVQASDDSVRLPDE